MGTSIPKEDILYDETNLAIATMFRDMGNIFDIAPPAAVNSKKPRVPRFTKTVDYSTTDTIRARGTKPKEIKSDWGMWGLTLLNHAIKEGLDRDDMIDMFDMEDMTYDHIVNNLTTTIINNMHNAVITELNKSANYGGAAGEVTIAGGSEWDQAGAVPRTDMVALKTKFRTRQGAEPSVFTISRDVVDAMIANVTDWTTYWANKMIPDTETEQLEKYFSIPKIIILDRYKGINGAFTSYYTETGVLLTIDPPGTGELIGNIQANRSALRFYFLDQNSPRIQKDPTIRDRWGELGVFDKQIIQVYEKWDAEGYTKFIYENSDWTLDVSNTYGMARFVNLL